MVWKKTQSVTVHQALHGYADGHRLLASSRSFSKVAQRIMLVLSDLSGPSVVPGFISYLTGYPLQDEGLYAVAKTWYASEMKRPGCVWTHTLLIEDRDLEKIQDIAVLKEFFQQPRPLESTASYTTPLEIALTEVGWRTSNTLTQAAMESVFLAVYGSDSPVFLLAKETQGYEDLILRIWNQQWPSLRKIFRWCTGAISIRTIEGEAFDLQVIPLSAAREIHRQISNGTFIDLATAGSVDDVAPWMELALSDLVTDEHHELQQFLWQFASEGQATRATFRQFAEVFLAVKQSELDTISLKEIVSVVAEAFPRRSEAQRLKVCLFGDSAQRQMLQAVEEITILREFALTSHHEAFDSENLRLYDRGKKLWDQAPRDGRRLLSEMLAGPLNPLGEAMLSGIAEAMVPEDVAELARGPIEGVITLIQKRPELAATAQLWTYSVEVQKRLMTALVSRGEVPEKTRDAIVCAQLTAGVDEIVDEVTTWAGQGIAHPILDWLASQALTSSWRLPGGWRKVLAVRPNEVVDWLNAHPEMPIFVAAQLTEILDPHSQRVRESNSDVWLRLADHASAELDQEQVTEAMAFILALGFNNPGEAAPELVSRAFPIVYEAAARDVLSDRAWNLLKDQLPAVGWWWDRCKALRVGLVQKFVKFAWPTVAFLSCMRDPKILRLILDRWGWNDAEMRFLRCVIRDATKRRVYATTQQLELLARYAQSFEVEV